PTELRRDVVGAGHQREVGLRIAVIPQWLGGAEDAIDVEPDGPGEGIERLRGRRHGGLDVYLRREDDRIGRRDFDRGRRRDGGARARWPRGAPRGLPRPPAA